MTMHPQEKWTIPEDTKRIAHAVFKKGNIYLKIAEQLGQLYEYKEWIDLYPTFRTSICSMFCSIFLSI